MSDSNTSRQAASRPGRVYLVGGGPGDPGLITLRGVECLRQADVVLYDYLINPRILEHAPAHAELVCLGRHGRDRILSQAEVNERMVAAALAGNRVVRLKGGDPIVFARIGEETEALLAAGISYEVVPGITAALAAGSYAGIPLTHRETASAVALVTGHEKENKESPQRLDYARLANFPGTLVFYMGVTTAGEWTQALVAGGKPANTPVAVVRRCSWPDQQVVYCTLETLVDAIAERKLRPPALAIVGEAAAERTVTDWFTQRPLFGQRVLVTRPREQCGELVARLESLGADCSAAPAIRISSPQDWAPVDAAMANLAGFDWVVFSSANGVRYFLERLLASGRDLRALGGVRLAAIGPGTADALGEFRLRADLLPDEYRAESLAGALNDHARGQRFLLIRASRGREVLAEQLVSAGGQVEQIVVYQSVDVDEADSDVATALASGSVEWVTVTSSAIARSLARLYGSALKQAKLASISPITSGVLRELGFEPEVEAEEYTMAGLVQAILAATTKKRSGQG